MMDACASVQRALAHLAVCRPNDHRACMVDLMTAGVALCDDTRALHLWLERAWDRLDADPDRADFAQCEARLLAEIQRYEAMHTLLGQVLTVIAANGGQPKAISDPLYDQLGIL